jgi:hypothetical protein
MIKGISQGKNILARVNGDQSHYDPLESLKSDLINL